MTNITEHVNNAKDSPNIPKFSKSFDSNNAFQQQKARFTIDEIIVKFKRNL